ncbi:MAG: hypothetical protein METHSR3v1_400003 [Methanothrix sp.]|nr:MAG: hypothetical protein METHSR3v1_400003 [Methanothrix sp.]
MGNKGYLLRIIMQTLRTDTYID